jgi:tRNA (guanine-N7-)-methyltransferase
MRRKNKLGERVEACGELLLCKLYNTGDGEPAAAVLDSLSAVFGNANPVRLEIGCGKGGFVTQAAALHPQINFIAAEKIENVAVTAMERVLREKHANIRFITGMAEYLGLVLPPQSVEIIYLNFSCPFPKERHAKHRLTHESFLNMYKKILIENGKIIFKTDNYSFFEFSVESLAANGFYVKNITRDLHNSGIRGNIITEYEKLFIQQGLKINYLEAINK